MRAGWIVGGELFWSADRGDWGLRLIILFFLVEVTVKVEFDFVYLAVNAV